MVMGCRYPGSISLHMLVGRLDIWAEGVYMHW